MPQFPKQIEELIRSNYDFKFGDYISRGFDLVKNNIGLYIGFIVVFFLIAMVAQFIPFIGSLAFSFILSPCLMAGFYLATRKGDENQTMEFGDFFKGFEFLTPLLIAALIQTGILILALIPMGLKAYMFMDSFETGDVGIVPILMVFIFIIPLIYLGISWSFSVPLIVFHKMDAWPAMEASRKIISKNWIMFFLFGIVVGFIGMLGVLGLGIGLLFTIPAVMCMQYAAFKDIVGMPGEMDDDILNHLVTDADF